MCPVKINNTGVCLSFWELDCTCFFFSITTWFGWTGRLLVSWNSWSWFQTDLTYPPPAGKVFKVQTTPLMWAKSLWPDAYFISGCSRILFCVWCTLRLKTKDGNLTRDPVRRCLTHVVPLPGISCSWSEELWVIWAWKGTKSGKRTGGAVSRALRASCAVVPTWHCTTRLGWRRNDAIIPAFLFCPESRGNF